MARIEGGAVERIEGGAVARIEGGAVERIQGGAVERIEGGAVARIQGPLLATMPGTCGHEYRAGGRRGVARRQCQCGVAGRHELIQSEGAGVAMEGLGKRPPAGPPARGACDASAAHAVGAHAGDINASAGECSAGKPCELYRGGGGGQICVRIKIVEEPSPEHRKAVGCDASRVEPIRECADVVVPGGEGLAPRGAGVVVRCLGAGCNYARQSL